MMMMKISRGDPAGGGNSQTKAAIGRKTDHMKQSLNRFRACFPALLLMIALAWPQITAAQSFRIIRDAEIEKLIDDYSRPLLKAANLAPDSVGLNIVGDPNLNAFVTNGQNIFIHTGLILEAEEPNMVIGVIAHEIGHITGGHLARGDEAISSTYRPAVIATILGLGSILAGAGDIGMALITGGQQIAYRSFLTYSRSQEAAADNTALQLLEATGQSAEGIIGMMDTLANQEILSERRRDPYAQSHPMSRDRVKAYQNGARSSPFKDARDPEALIFRHKMVQAKIYGFLDSPRTTLRRYSKQKSQPARYARAIAYFRQGSRNLALRELDSLIAEMPDNPWLHELKGQIYYETGLAEAGIEPYRKAIALAPDEALLLTGLASCQIGKAARGGAEAKKYNEEAIKNLRKAVRLDRQGGTAYFQMSKAYGQLGQTAFAQWALAEYYAAVGSPEARQHAKRAIKGLSKGSVEYIRATDILSSIKDSKRKRQ